MSLILAIEPDTAQADAVRRAVRTLPGVDLVLVDSRDAALAVLKGRVPDLILLSALLPPAVEAALTGHLRTVAAATGHVELITIPLLEHASDDGKRGGLFGVFKKKGNQTQGRSSPAAFATELRAHLDRIAESQETTLSRRRRQQAEAPAAIEDLPIAIAEAPSEIAIEREWSGPSDTLGERDTTFDDEGRPVERVRLFAEYTNARDAIADRIVRLARVHRASVAQAFRIYEDAGSGRLILVSERVAGIRLSELLQRAPERSVVPDLPAGLFLIRRLLSIGRFVQQTADVVSLAIAPERIVVTPRGEVVVVEAALAAAIEARSAVRQMTQIGDVAQIAMAGLALILGRPMSAYMDADGRGQLLGEAADVASIRVNEEFSSALRAWFERAVSSVDAFSSCDDALGAFDATNPQHADGGVALRRTLRSFVLEVGDAGAPEDMAMELARVRAARARQIANRVPSFTPHVFAEPEPEAPPIFTIPDAQEPHRSVEPIVEEAPPAIFAPPPEAPITLPPPEPERRPTLLELFRTARSADPDEPQPSAPFGFERSITEQPESVPVVESLAPPPLEEVAADSQLFEPIAAEATADTIVESAPFVYAAPEVEEPALQLETPISFEPELAQPPVEETHDADPIVEEPPIEQVVPVEPPKPQRKRTSLLELFRSSRSRERTPEPDPEPAPVPAPEHEPASILGLTHEAADPIAALTEPEPVPVVFEEPAIAAATASIDFATPPSDFEPAQDPEPEITVEETPSHEEPPPHHEEPAPVKRPSLLEFLRSSRLRKSSPDPEPAPEPEPPSVDEAPAEPIVEPPPAVAEPLSDIFAELIQAARAVTPSASAVEEAPAAPVTDPIEAEWGVNEVVEPRGKKKQRKKSAAAPDDSDWPSWNLPVSAPAEEARVEPETPHEQPAIDPEEEKTWEHLTADTASIPTIALEPLEPRRKPTPAADDEQWPTWEASQAPTEPVDESESAAPPAVEPDDAPVAPPKKRRSLRDLFRSSPADGEKDEIEPQVDEHVEQPEPYHAPEEAAEAEPIDDAMAAFEAGLIPSDIPEPEQIPVFAQLAEPPPPTPPPPIEPPPTYVAPALAPPAPPTYQPTTSSPFVVPPPPPPIRIEPEAPVRMPSFEAIRPADPVRQSVAPAPSLKGPVTRRSAGRSGSRRWTRVGAAAIGIASLVIAARAYYLNAPASVAAPDEPAPKAAAASLKGTGSLTINSDPAGARVTVDGKPRGVTPLYIASLKVGTHKVVLDSTAGTVRREVKIAADQETTLDESIYAGWLAVYAPFEVQIAEGTKVLGSANDQAIMLAPGRHQLDLTNSQLGFRESRGIDVAPGQTTTINVTPPKGVVRISAPDGAEVWVDGQHVGDTPLGDLPVAIGAREIVLKHPELGEQHVIANVTVGTPAEVTIDFKRPKSPDE